MHRLRTYFANVANGQCAFDVAKRDVNAVDTGISDENGLTAFIWTNMSNYLIMHGSGCHSVTNAYYSTYSQQMCSRCGRLMNV